MDELETQYLEIVARVPKHISGDYSTLEKLDEAIKMIVKDIGVLNDYTMNILDKIEKTTNRHEVEILSLKSKSIYPYIESLRTTERRLRDLRVELFLEKPCSMKMFLEHTYNTTYSSQGLGMTTYIPGEMNSDYTHYTSRKDMEDKKRQEEELLASFNKTKSKA